MSSQLQAISKEMDKILACGTVNRHSFFQLQHFIVNKNPTTQSKLWQIVRELENRRDTLDQLSLEIQETEDNIELCRIDLERLEAPENWSNWSVEHLSEKEQKLINKEKDVKIRKATRRQFALEKSLEKLRRRLGEHLEECKFFLKAFDALQKIEPLKPFDDPTAQREYWNEKLTEEFNLAIAFRLPISVELIKTILSLNDESPIKRQLVNIVRKLQSSEIDTQQLKQEK